MTAQRIFKSNLSVSKLSWLSCKDGCWTSPPNLQEPGTFPSEDYATYSNPKARSAPAVVATKQCWFLIELCNVGFWLIMHLYALLPILVVFLWWFVFVQPEWLGEFSIFGVFVFHLSFLKDVVVRLGKAKTKQAKYRGLLFCFYHTRSTPRSLPPKLI
jgi:hypothetical protein